MATSASGALIVYITGRKARAIRLIAVGHHQSICAELTAKLRTKS